MDYSDYTIEDFVMDPDFRQWVKQNNPEATEFWESWLSRNPERAKDVEEARQIVLLLDLQGHEPTRDQYERVWARINTERQQVPDTSKEGEKNKGGIIRNIGLSRSYPVGIAAAIILLIVAFGAYLLIPAVDNRIQYTTGNGETKNIILSDSSEVTLNANSKLTHNAGGDSDAAREVWLEGEAFFEVNESGTAENRQEFIVHTDYMDVEVLGTKFNVNQRRGKTQVVLSAGKVKLAARINGSIENILMEPGELAEFGREQKKVTKKVVNPEAYTSWRNNLLVIDNKTMHKIVQMLEDNYGLEVEVKDSTGFDEVLQGKLPASNIDVILQSLSKTYGLDIQKSGNEVLIRKSNLK